MSQQRCPRCGGKATIIPTNLAPRGTKWYRCLGSCGKDFPIRENPAKRGVHHGDMRELELFIDNDETLYRQSGAIQENLLRKMMKNRYDHKLAPKLWLYMVNEGARRYVKEFGGNGKLMFPLAGKKNLAQRYANQFLRMLKSGEIAAKLRNPSFVRGAVATINSTTAATPMWMR